MGILAGLFTTILVLMAIGAIINFFATNNFDGLFLTLIVGVIVWFFLAAPVNNAVNHWYTAQPTEPATVYIWAKYPGAGFLLGTVTHDCEREQSVFVMVPGQATYEVAVSKADCKVLKPGDQVAVRFDNYYYVDYDLNNDGKIDVVPNNNSAPEIAEGKRLAINKLGIGGLAPTAVHKIK